MEQPKIPWPAETKAEELNKETTTEESKKPENFSWMEKGVLAAMAYPDKKENLKCLQKEAIEVLINHQIIPKAKQKNYDDHEVAEAEKKQYLADPNNYGIKVHLLYIPDFTAPSFEQVKLYHHNYNIFVLLLFR